MKTWSANLTDTRPQFSKFIFGKELRKCNNQEGKLGPWKTTFS